MSRASILGTLLPGFDGPVLPEWVAALLREGLAGVCLFGENVVSPRQLRELTDAIREANPDALIAIDEEGGDVTRLFYDRGAPYPGNAVLGRLDDEAATAAVAEAVGAALAAVGVNLDFAPDVDINSNPLNPVIGVRSFGDAPELVARHSAAWVRGLQSQGVAASIKHFPGHGDTAQDSHLALPTVDVSPAELRARELMPFAAAVEAGALTVMTSHILLPQLDPSGPATFSATLLQGVLRGELGFEGVVVSDALDMAGASGTIGIPAAAVRALGAGCDLLCIGTKNTGAQLEEILRAVEEALAAGELAEARVEDAAQRVRELGARVRVPSPTAARDSIGFGGGLGAAEVAAAFRVEDGVADAAAAAPGPWVVVRLDAEANAAVGVVPWDPFAPAPAQRDGWRELPVVSLSETTDARARDELTRRIPEEACVLVIGRDNARRPWVVELIDAVRERHEVVVTVDMGWPGEPSGYAQVATFGASALVGEALLGVLAGWGVLS
ncbi:beta-N-acetylhexosaminidase [Herbiconiux sp. KACC 21604]|uniref:beta-N-acetylhexosaminidase n=1 Tax=unclassified Herbiconiux TaxID=2618217 RepID=UPI0014926311|nr:beta-N-acetylhexosaminidase [Herbiconiux sp. SALV-R1]QJU52479.1 beta-N-acetylhexosaminidase [Herbiconiux sp. SALV-R1]WPO87353.1 beta-N-acetylhexosaminidase [Herbiconiux sp. KACC 21604]